MPKRRVWEDYPFYIPLLREILNLSIIGVGVLILVRLGSGFVLFYLLYVLFVIFLLTKLRCTRCYHHGRLCSTGFGKLAGLLYPKDTKHCFVEGLVYNLFLFLIPLIPLVAIIFLLVEDFTCLELGYLLVLLFLMAATVVEHLMLGCQHCHELEGCLTRWFFLRRRDCA
ncbi:MAG TPA: hypothetical protein DCW86_02835 [Actinobacteria bacterium]|nr:hypothetical protein [Actinomycetota bacterium]